MPAVCKKRIYNLLPHAVSCWYHCIIKVRQSLRCVETGRIRALHTKSKHTGAVGIQGVCASHAMESKGLRFFPKINRASNQSLTNL